jgi:hypothetical protein
MQMQKVHLVPGRVHMQPVKTHLAMTKVSMQPVKTHLQMTKVSMQPVKTHLEMTKVSMRPVKTQLQMTKVSLQPVKTSMQVGKVRADLQKVVKTVNCSKEVTITVVTFDVHCGKCHQQQMPTPVMVQGSRPQLPTFLPSQRPPRFPMMVSNPGSRPGMPEMINPGRPGMPNMVSRPNGMPGMPNMVSRPNGMPGLPNMVGRPQPQLRLPEMMQQPRPTSIVLREPLGPGSMPGTMPYGITSMPQGGPVLDLWALPGQPMVPSERPNLTARPDLNQYGMTTRTGSNLKKPARLSEMVTTKKAATKDLLEGLTGTSTETARPLPADVLQAPTAPGTQVTRSDLRGALSGGDLLEGIVDPTNAGAPESEPVLPTPLSLSPEDLQAPALPELPLSVLVLPPESDQPLPVTEDPDMVPGMPQAPEAPEFTPRAPDPVAGGGPRPDATRRLTADNSLAQPALPSDPTSTAIGPG